MTPSAAGIAAPQELSPFANRVGIAQETLALPEQLFTFARQQKATPYAVEKLDPEFLLEIADLTRQRGLAMPKRSAAFVTVPSSATVTKVRTRRRSIAHSYADRA